MHLLNIAKAKNRYKVGEFRIQYPFKILRELRIYFCKRCVCSCMHATSHLPVLFDILHYRHQTSARQGDFTTSKQASKQAHHIHSSHTTYNYRYVLLWGTPKRPYDDRIHNSNPRSQSAMASTIFRAFKFSTEVWDPSHRFETSWLLTPWMLFAVRATIVCIDPSISIHILTYQPQH